MVSLALHSDLIRVTDNVAEVMVLISILDNL